MLEAPTPPTSSSSAHLRGSSFVRKRRASEADYVAPNPPPRLLSDLGSSSPDSAPIRATSSSSSANLREFLHRRFSFELSDSRGRKVGSIGAMVGRGVVYWGTKEVSEFKGIVVLFAWASIRDDQLKGFVHFYASLGWNSLVSHALFVDAFYPERAMSSAFVVLNELVKELRFRPCPVVFVPLSGGTKASMYKVLQIVEGMSEGHLYPSEYRLVRSCISGHVFDSSPVDFTAELGTRHGLHPRIQKMPGSSKLVSWVAKGIVSGLDALYLTRFESQRSEYWQALYSSVNLGAPFLILGSEKDDLAPFHVICNFTQRLQELGGDVKLVKLKGSPHLGHYKHHPIQYRVAVTDFLEKATLVFSQKMRKLEDERSEGTHDEISGLISGLQSLRRVSLDPSDHFYMPSSVEPSGGDNETSQQDDRKEKPVPPSINAHSVLGQLLFDACVPKNVEGWDIKFSGSLNGQPLASARRLSPSHGSKSIRRRSRL